MQQFTDTEGFFETFGIFFSHFSQIKPTKRWSIQKLCFSLLRIDGPLVSRFDYKVFTSVLKTHL
ncbi:hypothetical protein BACFIN_05504 [Bacteroides finegoldii DSM 17565]|nr:hypothetical protein BACFIN_05504 [Bacteroides finegoldii DSM 17565]